MSFNRVCLIVSLLNMNNLFSYFKLILLAGLIIPTAYANWEIDPNQKTEKNIRIGSCSAALFEGNAKVAVWTHGPDRLIICADTATPAKTTIELSANFEVKVILNGKTTVLAQASEVGASPIQLTIKSNEIELLTYLSESSKKRNSTLTRRLISCASSTNCALQSPTCALTSDQKIENQIVAFKKNLQTAPLSRRQIQWKELFFDGPSVDLGDQIIEQAIVGSKLAFALLNAQLSLDGGAAETQLDLTSKVKMLARVCKKKPPLR